MKYADNSIVSNPGSGIATVYGPKVDPDGTVRVVEVGKEDLHAYIQSQRDMTDMSYILARMAAGDTSVLAPDGFYGDVSSVPNSLAGVLQLQIDSNNLFSRLPLEIKKEFDFDPNKFFAQSGSMDWYEKIKGILPDDVKKTIWTVDEKPVETVEKGEE